ncbi:TolC family outer membrane protein [Anderseniella sp. Alg231-50]|uniref:TolC family outer membrane protein n=1 Tax=Anderseniella sp. Alg231-50 TaxID=1922226 RepID=UPI00307BA786
MRFFGKRTFAAAGFLWALIGPGQAMSLTEAVSIAVDSNPEIGQAIANREAIEFELEQGRGLFRPRVDLEARIGGELRDSATTRLNGDDDHVFLRRDASIVARQLLFDGFESRSEVERQAARVDGASFRVFERSEFIALAVTREYLNILRLRRIVTIAARNEGYHRSLLSRIGRGASGGSISTADRDQAQERLFAARARLAESKEDLTAAEARFLKLVGRSSGRMSQPRPITRRLPPSLSAAIGHARVNNPSIKIAQADIDAADALVRKAKARFAPKLSLEGRASAGDDVSGIRGQDNDIQGNVVMSWNLLNGGIDRANVQEQVRRVDESRMKLHQISRDVEEAVRLSWNTHKQQRRRLQELRRQERTIGRLVESYSQQFGIGERSLLDVLDTQNTRFSAQSAVVTSETAVRFARYRILAATGQLLSTLGVRARPGADAYARDLMKVPPTPEAETHERHEPDRANTGLGPLY